MFSGNGEKLNGRKGQRVMERERERDPTQLEGNNVNERTMNGIFQQLKAGNLFIRIRINV